MIDVNMYASIIDSCFADEMMQRARAGNMLVSDLSRETQ